MKCIINLSQSMQKSKLPTKNVVYQGKIRGDNGQEMICIGSTERPCKERYHNYKTPFLNGRYANNSYPNT